MPDLANPTDPNENQLFRWAEDIPAALWDDLCARPAAEAAAAVEAQVTQNGFLVPLLANTYLVDAKARRITCQTQPGLRVDYQSGLVLLTALAKAMDAPAAGEMATFTELPGGDMFFAGPHAIRTRPLVKHFGGNKAALVKRALEMGGEEIEGGDAGVKIPGLPRAPLYVLLWEGDEEFEARAVMGTDRRAHMQMALDGLWALSNLAVTSLVKGL